MTEFDKSTKTTNGATDLVSLHYVPDAKHDYSVVSPSRWATFDCKTTMLLLLKYTCFSASASIFF